MKENLEENQDLLWQTDRYESLKLAESPWENNKVSISYTIPGIERKNEEDTNNLRVKTLEHIDNTYPHDTCTHIYTDGSSDNMKAGGAGIHIWHSDCSKEDIAKATGSICSNFKAEVIAIKTALEHIQANQDNSGEEQKYIQCNILRLPSCTPKLRTDSYRPTIRSYRSSLKTEHGIPMDTITLWNPWE
ncbi:hypothetical protein ElyMa_004329300 [Elysia marginata]|uniref:RNase H type-1 domain-containing protein n=1 Tax=Elysia marginata TaxID=1093978 RepID=A0AAV4GZY0_9GAST|nr:hypothetical protein ElyMa_004329300 [Elysia marginata]